MIVHAIEICFASSPTSPQSQLNGELNAPCAEHRTVQDYVVQHAPCDVGLIKAESEGPVTRRRVDLWIVWTFVNDHGNLEHQPFASMLICEKKKKTYAYVVFCFQYIFVLSMRCFFLPFFYVWFLSISGSTWNQVGGHFEPQFDLWHPTFLGGALNPLVLTNFWGSQQLGLVWNPFLERFRIKKKDSPRKASAAALTRAFHDARAGDSVVPQPKSPWSVCVCVHNSVCVCVFCLVYGTV